jgi:deoxyribonuclease V
VQFRELHGWDLSCLEAIALQKELAGKISLQDELPSFPETVAGVDVSYQRHGELFFAAVVVLRLADLTVVEEVTSCRRTTFPYVPGLLSFRELPVVLDAFRRLQQAPDAVLVDGQGIAHPRRLGLASHLGLWLDLPTIGCAKSRLCGDHGAVGSQRGDRVPLLLDGDEIGAVLTTRSGVKPLYISPGHRISVTSAAELILCCGGRYRLPEPTRRAHHLANRTRLEGEALDNLVGG